MFDLNKEWVQIAHNQNRESNLAQIRANTADMEEREAIEMLRDHANSVELYGRAFSQQRAAKECTLAGKVLCNDKDAFQADDPFTQAAESYHFFNAWSLAEHMREFAKELESRSE